MPLHMLKMSLLIPPVHTMDSDEEFALLHKRIYKRSVLLSSFAYYKTINYELTDERKHIVKEILRVVFPFLEGT